MMAKNIIMAIVFDNAAENSDELVHCDDDNEFDNLTVMQDD